VFAELTGSSPRSQQQVSPVYIWLCVGQHCVVTKFCLFALQQTRTCLRKVSFRFLRLTAHVARYKATQNSHKVTFLSPVLEVTFGINVRILLKQIFPPQISSVHLGVSDVVAVLGFYAPLIDSYRRFGTPVVPHLEGPRVLLVLLYVELFSLSVGRQC
jgi:hypothetical protein